VDVNANHPSLLSLRAIISHSFGVLFWIWWVRRYHSARRRGSSAATKSGH